MTETFRLATRGSDLAIRQAAAVRDALETRRRPVELVAVETTGDRVRDELIHRLGKTGAFVRALDERVLSGDCEAAVHSMKDVPTESPPDLVVAGVPERAAPGDVLVTPDGRTLEELREGAVVGTSSLRRRAQLLAERPDLEVEPLRGNVDTRVEKLLAPLRQAEHERRVEAEADGSDGESDESGAGESGTRERETDASGRGEDESSERESGYDRSAQAWFEGLSEIERRALEREVDTEYDAIVLAQAGLERSGLLHHLDYQRLPPGEFVPAPGQGTIAVTATDATADRVHDAVDHARTRVESTVERTVLAELGGGCVAPIGVYAVVQGEYVHCVARVLGQDGTEEVADSRDLPVERHAAAAREFAADLRDRGAAALVEQARRETGEAEEGKRDQ
jgi:hydroxymethylbilane synthase